MALKDLMSFGRPLWPTCFSEARDIVKFALFKLTQGNQRIIRIFTQIDMTKDLIRLTFPIERNIELSCLAMTGSRLALQFLDDDTAFEVVGGHMATCYDISKDTQHLYATFPSEPVLAEGSSLAWQSPFSLNTMLKATFEYHRYQGMNFRKKRAVGQILMLHLMDHLILHPQPGLDLCETSSKVKEFVDKRSHFFSEAPVKKMRSLQAFLNLIAPQEHIIQLEDVDLPADAKRLQEEGLICFNHFVELPSPPDQETLKQLFRRCAAATFPGDHPGADLMIPILLPDQPNTLNVISLMDDGKVEKFYTFGLLLIRLKSSLQDDYYDNPLNRLLWERNSSSCSLRRLPTIGVLLCLQNGKNQRLPKIQILCPSLQPLRSQKSSTLKKPKRNQDSSSSLSDPAEQQEIHLGKRKRNAATFGSVDQESQQLPSRSMAVYLVKNFHHMIFPYDTTTEKIEASRETLFKLLIDTLLSRLLFTSKRANWGFNFPG